MDLPRTTKQGKPPLFAVGDRIGRLLVIRRIDGRPRQYECACDCGVVRLFSSPVLKRKAKSCGCLRRESTAAARRTHGMSGTRTYRIWAGVIKRCTSSSQQNFKHYGGRGISVCERWRSFGNFLSDMGQAPAGSSIERKDVNGNYEPGNCVWLPMELQNRNTRRVRLLELNGQTKCIAEWAEEFALRKSLVYDRIRRGWSIERALGVSP